MKPKPSKQDNKKNIIDKLNLTAPLSSLTPRIEIHSNKEAIIEGCKSILEYDENIIKLNTGKLIVTFWGKDLIIKCLTPDSLIVDGFLTNIEFSY